MANNSGASRRAALRQQQEMEERKKRTTRIIGFGLGAVALAVVVVLIVVIVQTLGKKAEVVAGEQQTPPNATAEGGINLVSQGEQPAEDAPHLLIYEDFQCPACAYYTQTYGPIVDQLVDEGKITVEYSMATFLDGGLGNDSSARAAMAGNAADAVGKFREFHNAVYANQPQEGVGYTDQQLRVDFPALAGIEGDDLTTFQNLYDTLAFADFVKKSGDRWYDNKIGSTPTYMVNGKKLVFYDEEKKEVLIEPTADDLLNAIEEANG
ncbi:DsbA family protein [Tessaracoccus caeni]|uniref:DsbA family protein n=1 Tax=Tessaracoccus caeni TaxID=3031239 RepID=UPI0023DCB58C|nr:thioredoxin domain-containing protein [Tessaracoccus caeni]MDF1489611.1 thioredoxin domain-containing protein [Tessaracoccus caeni]